VYSNVRPRVPNHPTIVGPVTPLFAQVSENIELWSDRIWEELGAEMEPDPVAAPAVGGLGVEAIRAVVNPLVNKEKVFRLAERTKARYRLLLAARPAVDSLTPTIAALPPLVEEFEKYLAQAVNAAAADDLRELVRQQITLANTSTSSVTKDATLEPDNVTLAFSDRLRTFLWLVEPLNATTKEMASNLLGFLQFLSTHH
jgi:hypothetical protein